VDDRPQSALLTDLYELTMAQAYFHSGRLGTATFSLYVRNYPPDRGYFVAAGLHDVLGFLESFAFDAAITFARRASSRPTSSII
jgi:nicotinate phosphoribosyltransferase